MSEPIHDNPLLSGAESQSPVSAPAADQPAGSQTAAPDVMPSVEEQLRALELKAAEHHDAWLRAKAETENVRRRGAEEAEKARKFAAEKFAQAMLPVKDSLEAALAAENATLEALKSGVELTLRQLQQAFQGAGLTEVAPAGERFDPNRHQAISAVEAEGEPNRVLTVVQKGYLLNDRVIRPALVVVSRAKAQGGSAAG